MLINTPEHYYKECKGSILFKQTSHFCLELQQLLRDYELLFESVREYLDQEKFGVPKLNLDEILEENFETFKSKF